MKEIKLEKYLVPHILEKEWLIYKEHIEEYIKLNIDEFLLSQKRDNCGIVAAGFDLYMEKKGMKLTRVRGDFVTDIGVYAKLDFYKEELVVMKNMNLNPMLLEDRMKYVEQFNLYERQKRIPHYWNMDDNGLVIDLSGYSQFMKTGLVQDLNSWRYEVQKPVSANKIKI